MPGPRPARDPSLAPNSATTAFTLSASATAALCDFQVVVTDGNFPDGQPKGGVITNHLVLTVQNRSW